MSGLAKLNDGKMVIVRYVTSVDEARLYSMFSTMRQDLQWSWPPYTREKIRGWMQSLDTIHVGSEWGTNMAGIASVSLDPSQRRRGVGRLEVYVHPAFQRRGLGTILVKEVLRAAAARRIQKVNAEVPQRNEAALGLLAKAGFQQEGVQRSSYLGPDNVYYDLILMGIILKVDL